MRNIINYALFLLLMLAGFNTHAAQQDAVGVTITKLYVYTKYGRGDVQIQVSNPPANCAGGFWLNPGDRGFKVILDLLISAYHEGSSLHLVGEDTRIWEGSSQPHCRLLVAGLI